MELEYNNVIVEQDNTATEIENDTVEEVSEQHQESSNKESEREENFRTLREEKRRAERERDALMQQLKSYELKSKALTAEEPEGDDGFADDDIIEGKDFRKVRKELKNIKSQIKEQEFNSHQIAVETRLKSQYPDFDSIVSSKNIEILRSTHPEIAATLSSSSDLYSSAVSAYTFIKKLGIGDDSLYRKDKDMAHKNAAKPRPLTSVSPQQGDSPLSHANAFANGLTDELKNKLLQEMNAARRSF